MPVCTSCGQLMADVDARCDACGGRPKALRVRRPVVVSFVICLGVLLCAVVPVGLLASSFVTDRSPGPTAVGWLRWLFFGGLGAAVIVGAIVLPEIDWGTSVGARRATRVAVWVYIGLLVLVVVALIVVAFAIATSGRHCDTYCK